MQFMIIERYEKDGRDTSRELYARFRERGRLLPEGLRYVDSWVAADVGRCFQLMEADDPALVERWIEEWRDLVEFEVVPVIDSEAAARRVEGESE